MSRSTRGQAPAVVLRTLTARRQTAAGNSRYGTKSCWAHPCCPLLASAFWSGASTWWGSGMRPGESVGREEQVPARPTNIQDQGRGCHLL